MHVTVVALFSLALLLMVVALAREVQLRRSLQRLLSWLLDRWKGGSHAETVSWNSRPDRPRWRM